MKRWQVQWRGFREQFDALSDAQAVANAINRAFPKQLFPATVKEISA